LKKNTIIPIFIPHYGCPHQCIFCNQHEITGQEQVVTPEYVRNVIDEWLSRFDFASRRIEVAFYGGSFTALSLTEQARLLEPAKQALAAGKIATIRVSTRPDCITPAILALLQSSGVATVELGVQSLDNDVLKLAGRGHKAEHVWLAVRQLKEQGFQVGIQLMPGLPCETLLSLVQTAIETIDLAPDFVRIYPVIVLEDTPLADLYRSNSYQPLTVEQAVEQTALLRTLFENHHIAVIRTGLQATTELDKSSVVLAGPYHPAFGELVEAYLYRQGVDAWLEQVNPCGTVTIHCAARHLSKVRGQKNNNLRFWARAYPSACITVVPDLAKVDELTIAYKSTKYVVKKINGFSS
jgi:histone acetyltransferase (RNA polymerase elongator complex component)